MYLDPFTSIFLVWAVVPVGILLLAVLVLASGRGEPDPTNRRGYTVYLAVTNYVTLFVVVFATLAVVTPVAEYFLTDGDEFSSGTFTEVGSAVDDSGFVDESGFSDLEVVEEPSFSDGDLRRNRMVSDVVQAVLIAIPAVVLLVFHRRRRDELLREQDFEHSAPWRVDRAYVYATCFTAVVILLIAAAMGGFDAFRVVAPGVAGGEFADADVERDQAIAGFVSFAYLLAASLLIFWHHWNSVRAEHPTPVVRSTPESLGFPEGPSASAPPPPPDD